MSCKNCGGTMHGDGYTSPVVCEYAEVDTLEPDAGPVYCTLEVDQKYQVTSAMGLP